MNHIISFGEITYKIIYPILLCGILAIITKYLFIQAKEEKKTYIIPETTTSSNKIDFNAFSFISIRDNSKFPIIHILFISFTYTVNIIINIFFIMNSQINGLLQFLNLFNYYSQYYSHLLSFILKCTDITCSHLSLLRFLQ